MARTCKVRVEIQGADLMAQFTNSRSTTRAIAHSPAFFRSALSTSKTPLPVPHPHRRRPCQRRRQQIRRRRACSRVLRSVYITKKTTLSPGSCYGPAKTHLVRTDSSRWTEPRGLRPARRECPSTSPQPVSVHTRVVLGVHVPSPCPYTHAAVRSGSRRHLASYWAQALEGTSRG